MLRPPQRVEVAWRQEGLQVPLDIVIDAQPLAQGYHPVRVIRPVRGLGHRQVIDAADLNKFTNSQVSSTIRIEASTSSVGSRLTQV